MTLVKRRITRSALWLGLVGGLLVPASGLAQIFPNRVELAKYTCRQFLALDGDERFRVLIYLNGYLDGKSGAKVWDDKVIAARIDRAVDYCKATPTLPVLEAFGRAWKP